MELKRGPSTVSTINCFILLIVPYGIETLSTKEFFISEELLIVPYGIETLHPLWGILPEGLLIVPYGIETTSLLCFPVSRLRF